METWNKKFSILNYAIILLFLLSSSCNRSKFEQDASGTFEATEVIVSSEAAGKLEQFDVTEGDLLYQGQYLGYVDSTQLYLKKLQLQTAQKAVSARRPNMAVQISATKEQIQKAELEKNRAEKMFKANAATQKQVDDANSRLQVLKGTLEAQINSLSTSINSLNEESMTYEIQIAQIQDQLDKCRIINPVEGTVLNKYAENKEVVIPGKPLYKIADTKNLFLRAYVVSEQLEKIKPGQDVTVYINFGKDRKIYSGKISWISDKAEFTPKTIQTKDERQNLVYAIKVAVENTDGLIKIGMYGDVGF
ncbi:MAG: HlyD family efflux transporter periplasmic adaptor subunit [Dysgonamonadaceae bacterium]|jgi:HlyD family secretion protein|nr:HlyD family efflux transporter periplasmic adaptor subunit [Dysgonamonadaceae bacterium]